MQKVIIPLFLGFLALNCKESKRPDVKIDIVSNEKITWFDSLVLKYINQTDDTLLKLARNDTIPVDWMLDGIENTDTAKYFVFQIGHYFEHNFIADKWIYIDSITRYIYEYDLPKDSLIRWSK